MRKIFIIALACLSASVLVSCADPALSADYGDTLVYMPQATHNLGVDNNLELTVSASDASKQTHTTLGVYRSGTATKEAFEVDLHVVADTLAKAKALALEPDAPSKYEIYKTGVLLESKYYESLPDKISVPAGERQGMVQLVLKDSQIVADYPVGQILLLPVRIENPTKYTINEDLAFTMVVVRVVD